MFKRIATDVLGVLLIIAAGLLGWLPGPGGIPLLIAGLGLLAINHEWARRWLRNIEKHGLALSSKLFSHHPLWQILLDLLGLSLLGSGIWLFASTTYKFLYAVASSLLIISLYLLLGNRQRFSRLKSKFKP